MIGKLFQNKKGWHVISKESSFTLPLTKESEDSGGYKKDLKDGEEVEFEIIHNYGFDPYDNQFPGIDYYDAAKIIKHLTK